MFSGFFAVGDQSEIRNRKSSMALALPLLVARVLANDADHVLALHDAAGLPKPFDGCSYFHGLKSVLAFGGPKIALGKPSAIRAVSLLLPEGNTSLGQIVGGHF